MHLYYQLLLKFLYPHPTFQLKTKYVGEKTSIFSTNSLNIIVDRGYQSNQGNFGYAGYSNRLFF